MKYNIQIDEKSRMLGVIYSPITGGVLVTFPSYKREEVISWIVEKMAELEPDGPVRATRKKVYNERVIERPGFWEVTTYNAKGEVVRSGQYRDIMQEGYLRGLVQDQFGFPLEAAEEIK